MHNNIYTFLHKKYNELLEIEKSLVDYENTWWVMEMKFWCPRYVIYDIWISKSWRWGWVLYNIGLVERKKIGKSTSTSRNKSRSWSLYVENQNDKGSPTCHYYHIKVPNTYLELKLWYLTLYVSFPYPKSHQKVEKVRWSICLNYGYKTSKFVLHLAMQIHIHTSCFKLF